METQHNDPLFIFINRKKFHIGITPTMTVDQIAHLVDLTAETAVVRREHHGKAGEPLQGTVEVHRADHFVVTRRRVEGGFDPVEARIEEELRRLRDGGQMVDYIAEVRAVIYRQLPVTSPNAPLTETDVLVLAGSYPAGMLDLAFLPDGSPLIGRVKGAPQGEIVAGGIRWRQISYHPHNGGGGAPWNPNHHGFHTYLDELLAWLGAF